MLRPAAASFATTPRAFPRVPAPSSGTSVTRRVSEEKALARNSSSSNSSSKASSLMASSASAAASGGATPSATSSDDDAVAALVADCMPKSEVGADAFLASRGPDSNGRGTVVVVLDTGVDPACSGMRETPGGGPKLLDVRDCTGGGDVATTIVRRAAVSEEGGDGSSLWIESASGGKRLRINPAWPRSATGEYRVGCKRLFELVPGSLRDRLAADRRRAWDERHAAAVARAEEALALAKKKGGQGGGKSEGGSPPSSTPPADGNGEEGEKGKTSLPPPRSTSASPAKKLVAEAEAALELLAAEASNYDDAGPWVEAVVFRDEAGTWRAALDTAEAFHSPLVPSSSSSSGAPPPSSSPLVVEGSLETAPALASYRLERKHGVFSARSACSYALTVLDGGEVLEICVDAGAHGSHCASIAAGHEPGGAGRSALDGVAPGAQVISYKIGDSRFGSMETGTGLARALALTIAEARNNPELSYVINMSYGEATSTPDAGSFIALANEAVDVHGVHFVSSAGNAGPALGTVGAPGGTSSSIIAVGAYVSPGMAAAAHSLRSGLDPSSSSSSSSDAAPSSAPAGGDGPRASQNYTWSSRGPTFDGDAGVVVSAPGAAVACVPLWCRSSRQLMNGTSMASPCAAGAVALLLSGVAAAVADAERGAAGSDPRLKGAGRPSPWRVRRALEATARAIAPEDDSSPLTYGRGLVQVPAAFEYLVRDLAERTPDAKYDVRVRRVGDGAAGSGRGLLLREPLDSGGGSSGGTVVSATVTITPRLHDDADVATELAVLEHALVLEATRPDWIAAPASLLLPHGGRSFEVAVDASRLPPGLHFGEVLATDAAAGWRGPLARVPITVIVPERVETAAAAAATASTAAGEGPSAAVSVVGDAVARLGSLPMSPGREVRRFLAAPEGATWAVLRLKVPPAAASSSSSSGPSPPPARTFLLRLTQHSPQTRYSDTESRSAAGAVPPGGEASLACAVRGGGTVEVTVSQFWSSHGSGAVEAEVAFHGVAVESGGGGASPDGGAITLGPAAPATAKVVARAPFRHERLRPSAKLTGLRWALRPKSGAAVVPYADDGSDAAFADGKGGAGGGGAGETGTISSETRTGLARGDTLPRGRRTHALTLEYSFDASEPGDYRAGLPLLTRMLYDSPGGVDAQLLLAFDGNKKLLGVSDVYPGKVKLPKGRATLRLRLRSRDPAVLRALSDATLSLTRSLEPAVSLPVFDSHAAALRGFVAAASGSGSGGGGKKGGNDVAAADAAAVASSAEARERTLRPGERAALFVGPLPDCKIPKDASPGSVLVGKLSLGRKAARDGGGDAPGSVLPVTVVVPPKAKKGGGGGGDDSKKDGGDDDEEDEEEIERKRSRTLADRRDEAARDAAVAFIRSLPLAGTSGDEKAAAEMEAVIGEALRLHGTAKEAREEGQGGDDDDDDDAPARPGPVASPNLPLLAARVKALSALEGAARSAPRLRAVADACEAVRAAVDVPALHATAARALPDESPGAKRRAKETKRARDALVEALLARAQALAELSSGDDGEKEGKGGEGSSSGGGGAPPPASASPFAAEFDAAVDDLRVWSDEKDARAARLYSLREERAGRPALALKLLDKALAAAAAEAAASATPPPTAADAAARARLLEKLGWPHAAEAARGRARAAFPNDYALF